jgi:hypothetical protein
MKILPRGIFDDPVMELNKTGPRVIDPPLLWSAMDLPLLWPATEPTTPFALTDQLKIFGTDSSYK